VCRSSRKPRHGVRPHLLMESNNKYVNNNKDFEKQRSKLFSIAAASSFVMERKQRSVGELDASIWSPQNFRKLVAAESKKFGTFYFLTCDGKLSSILIIERFWRSSYSKFGIWFCIRNIPQFLALHVPKVLLPRSTVCSKGSSKLVIEI